MGCTRDAALVHAWPACVRCAPLVCNALCNDDVYDPFPLFQIPFRSFRDDLSSLPLCVIPVTFRLYPYSTGWLFEYLSTQLLLRPPSGSLSYTRQIADLWDVCAQPSHL